jgi:hypothetical protein
MTDHSKDYYINLAELKQFENDTILNASKQLLKASGILYQIHKEVELYGIKSGRNAKYQSSFDRVFELDLIVTEFSTINDHNYQLRTLLKNSMLQRDKLALQNVKLKKEIESITKNFND